MPIKRDDCQGIRVTPNVYITLEEVDLSAEIVEAVAWRGSLWRGQKQVAGRAN